MKPNNQHPKTSSLILHLIQTIKPCRPHFIHKGEGFAAKVVFLFLLTLSANLLIDAGEASAGQKYVGSEGCQCHRSEIMDWEGSKHAKAFDLLLPNKRRTAKKRAGLNPVTDYSRDTKCIRCHVVGYKDEGGFFDIETTPLMAGVGCESCHGPGEKYRILHGKKPLTFKRSETWKIGQRYSSVDPAVCKSCHGHKDSPFQPSINKKYHFDLKKGLRKTALFHNYYKMKAKH